MADLSIREATQSTTNAINEAAQTTTSLVKGAGQLATDTVVQTAHGYKDAYTVFQEILGSFWERLPYLIIALTLIAFFGFYPDYLSTLSKKTLSNRGKQNLVLVLTRVGATFILFFGVMIALVVAVPGFTPGQLISGLGIGSVAIGFAFKDVFQNLLSGILLLLSEPFKIGDEIIAGSYNGIVESIQIRATNVRTFDGRRIVIPNAELFTNAVTVNTAYIKRRCSFDVGIAYNSDINQAKQVILKVLDLNRNIESNPEPVVLVKTLGDFAIILTVQWWVDRLNVGVISSVDEVQEQVKQALDKNNINIPFPTQQLLVDRGEPDPALEQPFKKKSDF